MQPPQGYTGWGEPVAKEHWRVVEDMNDLLPDYTRREPSPLSNLPKNEIRDLARVWMGEGSDDVYHQGYDMVHPSRVSHLRKRACPSSYNPPADRLIRHLTRTRFAPEQDYQGGYHNGDHNLSLDSSVYFEQGDQSDAEIIPGDLGSPVVRVAPTPIKPVAIRRQGPLQAIKGKSTAVAEVTARSAAAPVSGSAAATWGLGSSAFSSAGGQHHRPAEAHDPANAPHGAPPLQWGTASAPSARAQLHFGPDPRGPSANHAAEPRRAALPGDGSPFRPSTGSAFTRVQRADLFEQAPARAVSPPTPPTPRPSARTNWTRPVPHPVLIGHAASLTPY